MDATFWLMAANAAVWIGLGAYLAFLGARQGALSRRLAELNAEREREPHG